MNWKNIKEIFKPDWRKLVLFFVLAFLDIFMDFIFTPQKIELGYGESAIYLILALLIVWIYEKVKK